MKSKMQLYIIIIFIYLFNFSLDYIVFPFHYLNDKSKTTYNLEDISGKDFLELTTNKLVTTISIGSPSKSLELYITMDYKLFFIGKGYCEKNSISFYEPEESTTFLQNSQFYPYPFDDLRNMTIGNDTCTLYSDYNLGKNITLEGLHLLYGSKVNLLNDIYYKDKICGIMGMKLHEMQDSYYMKFSPYYLIKSLKNNNITNHSMWSIEYFNDQQKKKNKGYDGYLIFGAGDSNYLKKIKKINEETLITEGCSSLSNAQEWIIDFSEIYFFPQNKENKTKMSNRFIHAEINFDLDYYFVTKEYFDLIIENFFKPYLDSHQCTIHKLKEFYLRYQFISCVNNNNFKKDMPKFPPLFFKSTGFNYIFNLTYKDCFKEINNNQILFLFFYDPWSPDIFKFGKNFLNKYPFMFIYEPRRLGFLNTEVGKGGNEGDSKEQRQKEKKKLEIKQLIWIFILLILLIGIIIGIFVGKKIWDKNRKKRANELVDDYDYETADKQDKHIN